MGPIEVPDHYIVPDSLTEESNIIRKAIGA
jgi:hypothetical protein